MKQYLLAVHMVEGEPAPSEEEMQQAYEEVDAFNAELQAAGAWVFAGGLHPPSTATVVRAQGGQVVTTDGPFAETKEQLGRLLDHPGRRPGRRARLGGQGLGRLRRPGRGPAVPGDPGGEPERQCRPRLDAAAIERAYRESSGRAVATLVRVFGDIDLAEEAVQEAFAVAAERWPATGVPPNPGGWIVTTARNKALDRLRRESSRSGREAQAALLRDRAPSHRRRWDRCTTTGCG